MRRCYLVCYDMRDPKRLRQIHKLMKGYGEAWQYSVFFCILKDLDRAKLEVRIAEEINFREDQVMILDLGSNERSIREVVTVLGQSLDEPESGTVVV